MSSSARTPKRGPSKAYLAAQERAAAREQDSSQPTRLERVLAFGGVGIIVLAVISYFTAMIVAAATSREDIALGWWRLVVVIGYVGLPLGLAMIIALLIVSSRRRTAARQEMKKRQRS